MIGTYHLTVRNECRTFRLGIQGSIGITSSSQISIVLDAKTARQLEQVAETLGGSRNSVVQEALKLYLEVEISHIEAIKEGIAAAERGEFASEAEMARIFDKYRGGG